MQNNTPQPFIIWTLQRTGGTNLAQNLFTRGQLLEQAKKINNTNPKQQQQQQQQQQLKKVDNYWRLHEPFNIGDKARVFGTTTEQWLKNNNLAQLQSEIACICQLQLPIKHCVEMVPWEITAQLAKFSIKNNYKHLFLYRDSSIDRILSLHYATISGIWGRNFINKQTLDEKIFSLALPIKKLVEHELYCQKALIKTWDLLSLLGAEPIDIAYESIYTSVDSHSTQLQLKQLLIHLGLAVNKFSDEQFINGIQHSGEQGSRHEYSKFKKIKRLKNKLSSIQQYTFKKHRLNHGD